MVTEKDNLEKQLYIQKQTNEQVYQGLKKYIVEKFDEGILTQMVKPNGPDTITFGLDGVQGLYEICVTVVQKTDEELKGPMYKKLLADYMHQENGESEEEEDEEDNEDNEENEDIEDASDTGSSQDDHKPDDDEGGDDQQKESSDNEGSDDDDQQPPPPKSTQDDRRGRGHQSKSNIETIKKRRFETEQSPSLQEWTC